MTRFLSLSLDEAQCYVSVTHVTLIKTNQILKNSYACFHVNVWFRNRPHNVMHEHVLKQETGA